MAERVLSGKTSQDVPAGGEVAEEEDHDKDVKKITRIGQPRNQQKEKGHQSQ
jgi:hypothetical protein